MIPEQRIVLSQGSPEAIVISFSEDGAIDAFPDGATVEFKARLPGATVNAFTISCTFEGSTLSIPFAAAQVANAGNFDYSIWETVGGVPTLKLQGNVARGTGLEVVNTVS